MFDDVRKVIVGGTAILALIPAASLIAGLVEVPPDFDRFLTFTVGVTGPIVLFVSFAMRRLLARLLLPIRLALIGTSLIAGIWLTLATFEYATRQVEEIPERVGDTDEVRIERYVKPETLSGPLARIVNGEFAGSWRHAIVDSHFGPAVKAMIRTESLPVQRRITIMVNLAQSLLIFAFLLAAFTVVETMSRRAGGPDKNGRS